MCVRVIIKGRLRTEETWKEDVSGSTAIQIYKNWFQKHNISDNKKKKRKLLHPITGKTTK